MIRWFSGCRSFVCVCRNKKLMAMACQGWWSCFRKAFLFLLSRYERTKELNCGPVDRRKRWTVDGRVLLSIQWTVVFEWWYSWADACLERFSLRTFFFLILMVNAMSRERSARLKCWRRMMTKAGSCYENVDGLWVANLFEAVAVGKHSCFLICVSSTRGNNVV